MGKFFVAQGRVTPKQTDQSDPKSNSSENLYLSLLPPSVRKIQSIVLTSFTLVNNGTQGQVTPKQKVRSNRI